MVLTEDVLTGLALAADALAEMGMVLAAEALTEVALVVETLAALVLPAK